ncbi:winged helix-turn-helix domain-containing protein [Lampropedia aestuarii]|uniref:Winged helix-turn-helix domain-containing protein n=2 Tax=Lampropedia aestuarii TaxID=2562762 RepID=A0A4S5BTE3_9BURK|nr:winged helix-turn-helix domain-containing protein [Lampropedia aestuarii]
MVHPSQHAHWRNIALGHQGLMAPAVFGTGLEGTLRAIAHLAYVQIDTLSVIERAHHHVLWSRVPDYATEHLNQLVGSGQIFEYWFHAAAYLPMRDYRFALPRMLSFRRGESPYFKSVDPQLMREILAQVRGEGELRSRDLKDKRAGKSAWWDYGPGRRALDKLFMQGDLMVCERKGMEKSYALPERLLPAGLHTQEPSAEEMAAYLLDKNLQAHGIVTLRQVMHLRTGQALRKAMRELLHTRIEQGALMALDNPEWPDTYVATSSLQRDWHAGHSDQVQLLSPFDNAVIHRERLQQLFGFHYRLESYTPAAKRVHGYFCLPILWQGAFVGRIDCKAHRAKRQLEVLSLHFESGFIPADDFSARLDAALHQLAQFCACDTVLPAKR